MTMRFVAQRVPLVDVRTGAITREWYLLLSSLFQSVGGGSIPDPEDDNSGGAFLATQSLFQPIEALELSQAVQAAMPDHRTELAEIAQALVETPSQDMHARLDELEMLIADLAAQTILSLIGDRRVVSGLVPWTLPDEADGDPIPAAGSRLPYLSGGVMKIA